jgi:hypothetical protein
MGLFSSKYVTNVSTTVARVIEDHSLPNSLKHGALKGLLEDPEQIVEYIQEEMVGSLGIKAHSMFRYGKNTYLYGLPSGSIHASDDGRDVAQTTIASIVGQSVTLDYYHFGVLNNLHVGWVKLITEHGYNTKTNVLGNLTAAKGKPVVLNNMVVVVQEATLPELSNGSLDQWGTPPWATSQATGGSNDLFLNAVNTVVKPQHLFEVDATAANDYVRVEYSWLEDVVAQVEGVNITRQQKQTGSFRIELLGLDDNAAWHQAKYTRADGEIGYWLYQAGTNTYPEIDSLHDPDHDENGSYFPFGYFRYAKVSGLQDKNSDWFKHSKKLMNCIGIDYETVTDAIHQNPGIENVEQAMLTMAVPAVTENQVEMRYLFDYFSELMVLTGGSLGSHPIGDTNGIKELINKVLNGGMADNAIIIQDKRFKMALSFRGIYKTIVQGSIGDIGTYACGWNMRTTTEDFKDVNTGESAPWNTTTRAHWYRKQVSDTQYEEVQVSNLKMTYYIYGDYTTVGDENDDILLVPIDKFITNNYTLKVREELYARSLHYVFNSRVITEVKWYQQGWFRALMVVAAIVITIITQGATWQAIGAALVAGTITIEAVIYMIAIAILKYVAISIAVKLFIKVVGVKFALIVAIVAAIAGSYQAIEAGSIKGAPWASQLLQASTSISKGVNLELKREFAELKVDAENFQQYTKDQKEKLDAAKNLLVNDTDYLTPIVIFGEKPTEYFQRTVHSGNIGVLGLDAISAYVDVALQLPKLTDTL